MNKKCLRVPNYLAHILSAVERIKRYMDGKLLAAFAEDEKLKDAVIRNLE